MNPVVSEPLRTKLQPPPGEVGEDGTSGARPSWMYRHGHRIGPLLILLFSGIVIVNAFSLRIGALSEPGPGFWPMIAGALTAIFALVELIVGKEGVESFTRRGTSRVVLLAASLLLIPLAYDFVGFLIPTIVVVFVMMTVLSKQRWWKSLLVGVILAGSGYYVFAELLQVRLNAF